MERGSVKCLGGVTLTSAKCRRALLALSLNPGCCLSHYAESTKRTNHQHERPGDCVRDQTPPTQRKKVNTRQSLVDLHAVNPSAVIRQAVEPEGALEYREGDGKENASALATRRIREGVSCTETPAAVTTGAVTAAGQRDELCRVLTSRRSAIALSNASRGSL